MPDDDGDGDVNYQTFFNSGALNGQNIQNTQNVRNFNQGQKMVLNGDVDSQNNVLLLKSDVLHSPSGIQQQNMINYDGNQIEVDNFQQNNIVENSQFFKQNQITFQPQTLLTMNSQTSQTQQLQHHHHQQQQQQQNQLIIPLNVTDNDSLLKYQNPHVFSEKKIEKNVNFGGNNLNNISSSINNNNNNYNNSSNHRVLTTTINASQQNSNNVHSDYSLARSRRDSGSNINTSFGGIIFSNNNNNSNLNQNLNQKNSNIPNTARQTVQSQSQVGNISTKDNTLQSNNTIKNVVKNDAKTTNKNDSQISQLIFEKEKINLQPSHPPLSEPKSPIDHSGLVLPQPLKHPGFMYKNNTPGVGSGNNKSGDMLLLTKNQNNKKSNQSVEIIETKFQPPVIRDSKTVAQQYSAMLQSNIDVSHNNEHNGRKS
jgi:hypothetical protein